MLACVLPCLIYILHLYKGTRTRHFHLHFPAPALIHIHIHVHPILTPLFTINILEFLLFLEKHAEADDGAVDEHSADNRHYHGRIRYKH